MQTYLLLVRHRGHPDIILYLKIENKIICIVELNKNRELNRRNVNVPTRHIEIPMTFASCALIGWLLQASACLLADDDLDFE